MSTQMYERAPHGLESLYERFERGEAPEDWRDQQSALLRQHPANPLLEKRHDLAIEAVQRIRRVFTDDEIAHMSPAVQIALTAW